jgi:hypothetical protein
MTKPTPPPHLPRIAAFCEPGGVRSSRVCPAKGSVHIVHTLVHGRRCCRPFGPFLLVMPSPLHDVLCCRRHDFTTWIVGVRGRSGLSGTSLGCVCGLPTIVPSMWDPDFLPCSSGLVGPPDLGPRLAWLLAFPSAEHTQECNSDPEGWDAAVESWLRNGPPSSPVSL